MLIIWSSWDSIRGGARLIATTKDSKDLRRRPMDNLLCRDSVNWTMMLLFMVVIRGVASMAPKSDAEFTSMTMDSGFCGKIVEPFNQYNCTEFKVTTFDGFLVSIQRLQRLDYAGDRFQGDVFFLHPSLSGGRSWFLASNPTPLAVADAGYAVWIGHMRATEFSFGHNFLNPAQKEFWNWDMDELANYDFPSMVDFIFSVIGRKFHFVGYSQGARVGIGALSYQWNRAATLASVTLLAPVVYMTNTQSRFLLALNHSDLAELGYHIGIGKASLATLIDLDQLPDSEALQDLEREVLCQFTGPNCCSDPHMAFSALTGPYSVTTYKNLAHLMQSMRWETFMAYDYGSPNANEEVYQSKTPPKYNLSGVPGTVPTFVLYGGNDKLSTPTDIELLISKLTNQPEVLFHPLYAHLDFMLSTRMAVDVNVPILSFIGLNNKALG